MIPYGKQSIFSKDIEAVVSVLESEYLTQGPQCILFEEDFCKQVSAGFAVSANSATSSLHIACLALDIGPDDIVWTSPISFVASSNCALYCGASIDFVDIDSNTNNICIDTLREKLIVADASGKLPKVLIPVHLAGHSCDMKAIHLLSLKYGFKIIEDASHATGAKHLGSYVGCCQYSDIAVFSFHPVKIITAGEGGMAVTNNANYALKMGSLRSHGITRDPNLMTIKPDGPWFYQQIDLGFNYRMTDIHAALGRSQLKRLDDFVEQRRAIANRYFVELQDENLILPIENKDIYSSYHLFIIKVPDREGVFSRNELFNRLRDSGINVNLHYIPIYRHPYYQKIGFDLNNFPNAEKYYQEAISIPIFPAMTEIEQEFVVEVIKSDVPKTFKGLKGYQDLF
jgi:UDP-4-amino-4,6-dideoxy-N-acetyl-beta-L-altrosamine transaminase